MISIAETGSVFRSLCRKRKYTVSGAYYKNSAMRYNVTIDVGGVKYETFCSNSFDALEQVEDGTTAEQLAELFQVGMIKDIIYGLLFTFELFGDDGDPVDNRFSQLIGAEGEYTAQTFEVVDLIYGKFSKEQ